MSDKELKDITTAATSASKATDEQHCDDSGHGQTASRNDSNSSSQKPEEVSSSSSSSLSPSPSSTSHFPDRRTMILNNVLDTVGQTPCVRLSRMPREYGVSCDVVCKLEYFNPGGSVKDRIGKQMFLDAQAAGRMKPGDRVVEATSGNTGIGMSMAAAVLGYEMNVVMPVKMSHEKQAAIEALGAKVTRTPLVPSEHPDSLISVARRMEAQEGCHLLNQYTNESNWRSHYETTAQEIWEQCGGRVDMVVVGTGTGGTMTGIAKRLQELNSHVIIVGVDPHGSLLADPSQPLENVAYQVEGIGYDFIPGNCHREYVDQWIKSSDRESFAFARELMTKEGILAGGSSGSALWAALQAAKRLRPDQRCVVILPDGIRNYMTKFLDDNWLKEKGLKDGPVTKPTYQALESERDVLRKRVAELEEAAQKEATGNNKTDDSTKPTAPPA